MSSFLQPVKTAAVAISERLSIVLVIRFILDSSALPSIAADFENFPCDFIVIL